MAKTLGLDVIAEGVETAEELFFLSAHGCTEIQGYHIARPMPADKLPLFLDEWTERAAAEASPVVDA